MDAYTGRYAGYYDLFYADKPYAAEAGFVHSCLEKYSSGPVRHLLELACGTGNHAIAFERLGYKVLATDASDGMLEVAAAKARAAGSSVRFLKQDMTALELGAESFDAAVCLFDAIGYVTTNQAIARVLQGGRRHVRTGGLFIFEFWHAGAMLSAYDPVRVRRWATPSGELLRISETTIDYRRQVGDVRYTLYEMNGDGTYTRLEEMHSNRFFLVQEMAALLSAGGFTPLKWFAGFSDDEAITQQTWHVVAVARVGER